MSDTIERVKCLIIGSGSASNNATIYTARGANIFPFLYQGIQLEGQLTTTNDEVEFICIAIKAVTKKTIRVGVKIIPI
ncbi:hypothetical protein LX77_01446 [Gelidibacter algens]|uniref:Uncharacterized protein n=1 Tax=Gelidibacter algens TaxID=49280 RepID=A0A327S8Z1_9FLAO|nr:hypothetical protein LX77_01446 [Gelidibacter algens]